MDEASLIATLHDIVDQIGDDAAEQDIQAAIEAMTAAVHEFTSSAVMAGRPSATFANPWHDEIGRFAPKGSGRRVGSVRTINAADLPELDRGQRRSVVAAVKQTLHGLIDMFRAEGKTSLADWEEFVRENMDDIYARHAHQIAASGAKTWRVAIGRFAADPVQAQLQAMVDGIPADATDDEIDAVLDEMSRLVADALDSGSAMSMGRPGEFANPWHDEIGRFAPKGTGSSSGYQDKPRSDNGKPPDWHGQPRGAGERGPGQKEPNTANDWHGKPRDDSKPHGGPPPPPPPPRPDAPNTATDWHGMRRDDPAFPDRVVRILNDTVAANAPTRIRDRLKKWGDRIAKLADTGPVGTNPVFPWLR